MSGFQALEPQPTAEVVLHTTAGDLRLELFAKQTPQTSRNFLQLCLDGYYVDTIFHRLVPSFILQGGDPTGTGSGGESSYGQPFEDEFHSRLKFNRRGLLGMANTGRDDNGSQFFLTLGEAHELNGKNTMFGRVSAEGDTIYNLMKMAEADVSEGTERPMYPTKVTEAEIITHPFDDLVKRVTEAPRTAVEKDTAGLKRKPKRKAGKNVLSFGGDEEEGDEAPVVKKPKFDPTLVSAGREEPQKLDNTPKPKAPPKAPPKEEKSVVEAKVAPEEPERRPSPPAHRKNPTVVLRQREPSLPPSDESDEGDDGRTKQSRAFVDRTNNEIARLKASMRRTVPTTAVQEQPKTGLEAFIPATSSRGRKRGTGKENESSYDLFNAFRAKLDTVSDDKETSPPPSKHTNGDASNGEMNGHRDTAPLPPSADEEAVLCDLHFIANCQSCTRWDEQGGKEEDDDGGTGWMSHALSFAKDRLGKDLEWKRKNEEDLVVIDPREKAKGLKEERKRDRPKEERKR